jgi:predicted MFS family arabinose efflux permease
LPGFILGYIFAKKLYAVEKRWLLLERPIQHDVSSKLKHVLANSMFLVAFLACLAYFFSFGAILAYAPLYATQQLLLSNVAVASMFFGCYLVTTLTRLPLRGLISKWRFSKETLALSAQVITVLLAFTPSLAVHPSVFALVIVLFGISQGIIYPVGAMIASETVSPAEHVLANSLYLVAWDLGLALGPTATSTIASTSGILSALAVSSILPAISATTLLCVMIRGTRNAARENL